jgi:hypothetical protein
MTGSSRNGVCDHPKCTREGGKLNVPSATQSVRVRRASKWVTLRNKRHDLVEDSSEGFASDQRKLSGIYFQISAGLVHHTWHEDFELLDVKLQRYGELEIIAKYCGPDYSYSLGELRSGIRYLIPLERIIDISQKELDR